MGCGSGRWAKFIAPKVKILNCIDPSFKALKVAKIILKISIIVILSVGHLIQIVLK